MQKEKVASVANAKQMQEVHNNYYEALAQEDEEGTSDNRSIKSERATLKPIVHVQNQQQGKYFIEKGKKNASLWNNDSRD